MKPCRINWAVAKQKKKVAKSIEIGSVVQSHPRHTMQIMAGCRYLGLLSPLITGHIVLK